MVYSFFNIVFPAKCFLCKQVTLTHNTLCDKCWLKINFVSKPLCYKCGTPLVLSDNNNLLCGECILNDPPFSRARFACVYDENSSRLITNLKYGDQTHLASLLSKIIYNMGFELIKECDIICPVPLHKLRLLHRKFNQSALICLEISKRLFKSGDHIKNIPNLLIKRKNIPPQASLKGRDRIENVKRAFTINKKYANIINGKNILLVDDVITTGSTVSACAKQLIKYGAKNVNVLAFAKSL